MRVDRPVCIRVVVVDDHVLWRQVVMRLLRAAPGIEVVGEAGDGRDGVDATLRLRPDVVLMDLTLPDTPGTVATESIRTGAPEVQVIGLSMHDDVHSIIQMRRAGAAAYVLKTAGINELVATIRFVAAQE